jgi:hypothetical protein
VVTRVVNKAFHHLFERAREYKNFFCSNNIAEVLARFEGENFTYVHANEMMTVRTHSPQNSTRFFEGRGY